jgi:DNA-binding HxlR family transcriptional regulator
MAELAMTMPTPLATVESSTRIGKKEGLPAIDQALAIVGDKYSLSIVDRLYQNNAQRFVELEQGVTGISPRTLSARLKHLEREGLLHRQAFATMPPRVEYTLTEQGMDLAQAVQRLAQWADKWY